MTAIYSDLQNKSILVTGATRGIGKAIALSLANQKAHVIFNYRGDEAKAIALSEELLTAGATKVSTIKFDLSDTKAMRLAIDEYLKNEGPITGLVNNAGINKDQLLLRLKDEDLDELLSINLKGTISLCAALAKNFLRVPNGSIINVSSVVGLMGNAGQTAYAATKAGIIGATKSIAKELGGKGVRVNAICPGFIETEMTQKLDPKVIENYLQNIPLKRTGTVHEVSNLVNFLLSDASSYVTGEVIRIDGGLYI